MTRQERYEKFQLAKKLLCEISGDWNEEDVDHADSGFTRSFDEILNELCSISFKRI